MISMIDPDSSTPTDRPRKEPTEEDTLRRLASLCSRTEYSRYDIWQRLMRTNLPMDARQRIIDRLVSEHYIDDARFARALVHDKSMFGLWGEYRIKEALMKHGFTSDEADSYVGEIDRDENKQHLIKLLDRKRRQLKCTDPYAMRGKLIRYAMMRGFRVDEVMNLLFGLDDK